MATGTSRRTALRSALTAALVLVLAACGSGGGATSTTTEQSPATSASGAASTTTSASASTAASAAQNDATITISLDADPPRLDPAASSAFVDRQVLNSLCDKLFDLDAAGNMLRIMGSDYEVPYYNFTYTFTLREGATYHDGS